MQSITLADTGRRTTRLGFGCSTLMGATPRKQSLAILEAAFEAGIRHFDVAPVYGFGQAENCLGEFLARHRGEVTVTTKYGVPPPGNASLLSVARKFAMPVVRLLPGVKQRLNRMARSVSGPIPRASFTAEQAQQSLDRSLTQLQTDHIDVWLLHEVETSDLADDGLFKFLERSVAEGKIGTFGAGSGREKASQLLAKNPQYCRVLQFEWSVLDPVVAVLEPPDLVPFRIHHRALTSNFTELHAALTAKPELCRTWSLQVGADLTERKTLAALMLKASLVLNPNSIILFSSKSPQHIQQNVAIASDDQFAEPARKLYTLLQNNGSPLG